LSTYTYDQPCRRASLALPNTITTGYSYDILSRLLSINSAPSEQQLYLRPCRKQDIQRRTFSGAAHYVYDPKYRLIQGDSSEYPGRRHTIYDPVGNRLNTTVNAVDRLSGGQRLIPILMTTTALIQKNIESQRHWTSYTYERNRLKQVSYSGMLCTVQI